MKFTIVNFLVVFATFLLAVSFITGDCAKPGCWRPSIHSNKYCWKYCDKNNTKWCYTKSRAKSCPMVACETDAECSGCWECAGACAPS